MLVHRLGTAGVPGAPPALGWGQGLQKEEKADCMATGWRTGEWHFSQTLCKKKDSKDVGNWKLVVIRKNFTNHSISNGIVVKECEQVHLRWASKSAWHGLTTNIERKRWQQFVLPFCFPSLVGCLGRLSRMICCLQKDKFCSCNLPGLWS